MADLISTVKIEKVGGHEHVHVWNRGGKAGTLIVTEGDGEKVARRLAISFTEVDDLMCRARRAADKLMTMYARGEVLKRDELDRLLSARPRISAMIRACRGDA